MDEADPNYDAFDLLKTGVPYPGAIATGISRFSSISEVFVQFFHRIWLPLLLIFTITMASIDPHQAEYTERSVHPWKSFTLTIESGLIFIRSNTITRKDSKEDHLWRFGGKR